MWTVSNPLVKDSVMRMRIKNERNLLGLEDRAKSTDFQIALLKDRLPRCDGDDANVALKSLA